MRPDNVPTFIFLEGGSKIRLSFKYHPTQEELDAGWALLAQAIEYANKTTGQDIQIVDWEKSKES